MSDFESAKALATAIYSARVCGRTYEGPKVYQGPVPVEDFANNFKLPERATQHNDAWRQFFKHFGQFWASHNTHNQRVNA